MSKRTNLSGISGASWGRFAAVLLLAAATTYAQQRHSLSFRPLAADYSTSLDRMVLLSANPNQLHIYNASTTADTVVALSDIPSAQALSPDGLHAAVALATSIVYVNLQTGSIQNTYPNTSTISNLVLTSTHIYLFSSYNLVALDIATGTIYSSFNSGQKPVYDAVTNTIYQTNSQSITSYSLANPNALVSSLNSSYSEPICDPLWTSSDGLTLFSGCATALNVLTSAPTAPTYQGSFLDIARIQNLAAHANTVALVPSRLTSTSNSGQSNTDDDQVLLYDLAYRNNFGTLVLNPFTVGTKAFTAHGRWVFFNQSANGLLVVTQADSAAGLQQDFAIDTLPLSPTAGCAASFAHQSLSVSAAGSLMQDSILDNTGCYYAASTNVNWIRLSPNSFGNAPTLNWLVEANGTGQSRTGTITLAGSTLTVTQDATLATSSFNRLSTKPIASLYNQATDRLVTISASPNELHVYDPVALSDIAIGLPGAPLSLSVSPDGLFAAVGLDGAIAYVDLKKQAVSKLYSLDGAVTSLLLPGNGYLYTAPRYGSAPFYSLQLATNTWTLTTTPSNNYYYQVPPPLLLDTQGDYIYAGGAVYDVSSGVASLVTGPSSVNLNPGWISEDGARLFDSGGHVYFASPGTTLNGTPDGNLGGPTSATGTIAWLADSQASGKEAVLSQNSNTYPYNQANVLQLYQSVGLGLSAQMALPSFAEGNSSYVSYGKYVAWSSDASKLIVMAEADSSSGLLSDFASMVISVGSIPACSYSLSPTSMIIASGGSGIVNVTSGCNWSFNSPTANWLYAGGPSTGTGNGQVIIYTSANQTNTARTAQASVGTATLSVTEAPSTCTYQVSTQSSQFYAEGGTGSIHLAANANCSWTANAADSWISITSTTSGTGPADISFAVSPNASQPGYRSSTIYIAGTPIYISQSNTPATNTANPGLQFVPLAPCRVVDTRNTDSALGGPYLFAGQSRDFALTDGECKIPGYAAAYSLNVTAIPHKKLGYLTAWPAGQAQPQVSLLNSLDGRIKANAAILTAGAHGAISLFSTDDADVAIDVNGYFIVVAYPNSALLFFPMTPCRVSDTRQTQNPGGASLAAGESRNLPVFGGNCPVPANAQAYAMNVTAIPKSASLGYLSLWPAGSAQPLVSTLNATTGQITANAAIVPAGANGAISMFVTDPADVVVDINGYFAARTSTAIGLSLYPLKPCRALDTRDPAGSSPTSGVLSPTLDPVCGIPATAQALLLNATVVPPKKLGYLTLWPSDEAQPFVSTLNAIDGSITSNMAMVPAAKGAISLYSSDPTYTILDVAGYFAP